MTALLAFFAGPIGRWVVIALIVAAAVAAAGLRLYNAGYAEHEAETLAETAEANQRARTAERKASERMAMLAATHHQEIENARIETDRLRADVRSGARRLSVVTAGVSGCAGSAVAGGAGRETRTELDPATSDALIAIAAAGDSAIRQANSLIDAYAVAAGVCGK